MITINFENVVFEEVPIDAQQVVTGIDLVVAGDNAGLKPDFIADNAASWTPNTESPYVPLPSAVRYRDVDNDEYNLLKTEKLADYFDPFLTAPEAAAEAAFQAFGEFDPPLASIVHDGDDLTYIENSTAWPGPGSGLTGISLGFEFNSLEGAANAFAELVIGWRLVYSANFAASEDKYFTNLHPRYVAMTHVRPVLGSNPTLPGLGKYAMWTLDDTQGDVRDVYAVFLPGIDMHILNHTGGMSWRTWDTRITLQVLADEFPSVGAFKIYHFYPLVVNVPLLENIASASIVKPSLRPGVLYVKDYIAPDSAITVEGFPGGNIVAVTKGFEYIHTREQGFMTAISLEQDSIISEDDYGQRRRAIDEMVNRKINSEAYSVIMGERS